MPLAIAIDQTRIEEFCRKWRVKEFAIFARSPFRLSTRTRWGLLSRGMSGHYPFQGFTPHESVAGTRRTCDGFDSP